MADKKMRLLQGEEHWDASDQSLLSATLMAAPMQRLAYASRVLKQRRFITKEEWEAMGSSQ